MLILFHDDYLIDHRSDTSILIVMPNSELAYILSVYYLLILLELWSTDLCQRLLILLLISPVICQLKNPTSVGKDHFVRDEKQSVPYCLDHVLYILLIQYVFLKEIHEAIGVHQRLKPSAVSSVTFKDNLIQTKTIIHCLIKFSQYACRL